MNVAEYTLLLNKPDAINDKQTEALSKIVQEFPYFQSARALYIKGLYNQNSFKYNYALKIAASHTTDRSVLFDFITSDVFTTIQKGLYEQKAAEILDISVAEIEMVSDDIKLIKRENTVEQSILTSIKEATVEIQEEKEEEILVTEDTDQEIIPTDDSVEKLDIGKPLEFSLTERHSFQEWLQLSKFHPIERETIEKPTEPEESSEVNFEKQKKNVLIDKFIASNPRIPPVKKDGDLPTIFYESSNADNSSLMTETLARVYLEQKKYQKAIQAYEILILKYPEKSSFFADRILDIKNLQQNNT
jgi:tetratricopeptide (TPR) repeat protein